MNIQDTLEFILRGIVTDNSSIHIECTTNNDIVNLIVTADPSIIGQLIGKEGKIIKSIRTILNLCYPNIRYYLEIKG